MSQYTIPTVVERTSLGERASDIYSRGVGSHACLA